MSYLVLARKWRPKTFSEVAGQEHVLRALINALDNDRLHHAFLFSGTRGVGKTTLARIFAKSINCERGVSSTPCGECSACTEIDQGRFVDLLEVDAASRTRVDDTRELLDNVQYAPTRGRYKVYLIDEVHMLSTHSFNALLKTLEEPPEHVKFLLATTDPQKLPVTVLSRCLQFNLKRLPPPVIEGQLSRIVQAEGYEHEAPALALLASAADGSMRDALSLLDQAIAHAGGKLSRDAVADMLGTVERTHVLRLVQALGDGDGSALMAVAAELAERGLGADSVLTELATACQQLALAQVVPDALAERVQDAQAVSALAARAPAEAVQLWYQIAVNGRRDLPLAPTPWLGLEMTLLRMLAFQVDDGDGGKGAGTESTPPIGGSTKGSGSASAGSATPRKHAHSPEAAATQVPAAAGPAAGGDAATAGVLAPVAAIETAREPTAPVTDATTAAASPPLEPVSDRGRVASKPTAPGRAQPRRGKDTGPGPPANSAGEPDGQPTLAPAPSVSVGAPAPAAADPGRSTAAGPGTAQEIDWERFAGGLGASGMLRQFADNCVVLDVEGKILRLQVDEAREHLMTRQQCAAMERAWREQHGETWRLAFSVGKPQVQTAAQRADHERSQCHQQALQSLREDPYVQALQQTFGAQLLEETVQVRQNSSLKKARAVAQSAAAAHEDGSTSASPATDIREAGARP